MAPPTSRIACLQVPDLPLAAELRAHPELVGRAVAIASAPGPRAEVLAVSAEAAAAGVHPFTTVVHARAACASLEVRVVSLATERAAREALLDVALSTSPRAEMAPPATGLFASEAAVFVDARGTSALFRTEAGFAGALAERARRLGLPAVVAVAGSRGVARIAARLARHRARLGTNDAIPVELPYRWGPSTPGRLQKPPSDADDGARGVPEPVAVVPPGDDARFLAPLPIDLLAPDDDLADALGRFGVRRIGELTRLSPRSLVTRFGQRITPLLALANGAGDEPPPPAPDEGVFEEAQDLETPLQHLEPFLFVLRSLLSRIAERLQCRGLAFGDLELRVTLDGGGRDERRIGVAAATLDERVLLRLLALSLEGRPPDGAIDQVRLATSGRPPRGDQLDFFRPAGPAPAVLDRTLAELTALCGEGRVGAPAVANDHRPDAVGLADFRPGVGTRHAPPPTDGPPPRQLAVRALRPPIPAQVHAPHGTPEWVRSGLANGAVQRCAGPWRTTGGWWSDDDRFAFDHFDVLTADGQVFRLRRDWVARRWEIDAIYD